jgi:hypothetical protein
MPVSCQGVNYSIIGNISIYNFSQISAFTLLVALTICFSPLIIKLYLFLRNNKNCTSDILSATANKV